MSKGEVLQLPLPLPEFGSLAFPELSKRLEKYLAQVSKLPDADYLLEVINSLIKLNRFGAEQRQWLKRLRQRTYDKKRRHLALSATSASAKGQALPKEIPRNDKRTRLLRQKKPHCLQLQKQHKSRGSRFSIAWAWCFCAYSWCTVFFKPVYLVKTSIYTRPKIKS